MTIADKIRDVAAGEGWEIEGDEHSMMLIDRGTQRVRVFFTKTGSIRSAD